MERLLSEMREEFFRVPKRELTIFERIQRFFGKKIDDTIDFNYYE